MASTAPTPSEPRTMRLCCFATAVGLLLFGVAAAWPHFADDAAISLRYADRLLSGHGLTWNDAERVEGYSNLAWVLLCAGLSATGIDLVDAARLLGLAFTLLTLLVIASASRSAGAAPVLAASATPAIWAVGGLEGPLVLWAWTSALLGLLRSSTTRDRLAAGLCAAVACLARPDGALLALLATPWLVLRTRRLAPAVAFALPAALAGLGQLAFRLAYYGDVLPNTAHVKLQPSLAMVPAGLAYVGDGLAAMPGLAGLALLGAFAFVRRDRNGALLPATLVLGWFGYLVVVGGDFFVGSRLVLPICSALAVLAAEALAAVPLRIRGAMLVLAVGLGLCTAHLGGELDRAAHETWPLDGLAIGRALARANAFECEGRATNGAAEGVAIRAGAPHETKATRATRDADSVEAGTVRTDANALASEGPQHEPGAQVDDWRILVETGTARTDANALASEGSQREPVARPDDWRILVDAAGAIPFASRLPAVDMLGLCDRRKPHDVVGAEHTPASAFVAAHRRSTPDHLLAKAPDLAIFGTPPGLPLPADSGGLRLVDDVRWVEGFRCVRWAVDEDRAANEPSRVANVWVRIEGRAGVQRTADTVRVPARLFGSLAIPSGFRLDAPDEPAARARWSTTMARGIAWAEDRVIAVADGAEFRAPGRFEFELGSLRDAMWRAESEPRDAAVRILAVDDSGTRDLATPQHCSGTVRLAVEPLDLARGAVRLRAVMLMRER